jgi:hypothetical protein
VREKIHALLSRAYIRLRDHRGAVGVNDLAAEAFSDIREQFQDAADEATILAHRQLKDEGRSWLRKNVCEQERQQQKGDGKQQLEFEGHLFQFLHPVYMIERGDDSFAVPISDLSLDEWKSIISRMDAAAITLAAEADEARTYVRLKFHADIDPEPSRDDEPALYETSAP